MKNLLIALVMVPVMAVAGVHGNGGGGNGGDQDLTDLIQTCIHFQSNPQIKEFNADVVCRGFKTTWEVEREYHETSNFLTNQFVVTSDIAMKDGKYSVNTQTHNMDIDNTPARCIEYAEVRQTLLSQTVTLETCADLQELLQEGRDKFCQRYLESAPVDREERTGRTRSTCR